MMELEKKQCGEIYDARDPELRELQSRAKDLMRTYNSLPAGDVEQRNRVLADLFGQMGKNVRVNQPVYVDYGCNIRLGDNSLINMHCTLLDTAPIVIGANTMIGPDVKIYTAVHATEGAERFWEQPDGTAAVKTRGVPVTIGSYTWIGGGSILLPGVTIGDNVVIGAGSVVTKSIPDNAIACGNPCQIKKWNEPLSQRVLQGGDQTAAL